MLSNQTAFVYKWTHLPSGKWYIGSRTAKGCHMNDGYICSSKVVKPMIENNPDEWRREIICAGNSKDMRKKERELLKLYDAAKNPMSFNRSNMGGPVEGSGRKIGNKNKVYRTYPDLHPTKLCKLSSAELADVYVQEKEPYRRFLLNKFIVSKVIL